MGGYIRLDKDLADDPRLMSAAEILTEHWAVSSSGEALSATGNRVTLRHVLRGVIGRRHAPVSGEILHHSSQVL